TVESGRGCPWACRFCSTSAFFARRHRARDVDRLVDELGHLYRAHGVRHVTFTDDIFTVDKRWARAFCEAMIARGPPLAWGCSTRIDRVDPGLLALMAQARCDSVLYGVETGSPRLQQAMGKRLDVAKVAPTVQATRAAGIRAYCTFIFGFPEETPADLAQSFDLAWRLLRQGVHVTAQTLCVLPDTPYFNEHFSKLRFDGFSSLSRAALSPDEAAVVQAHPALFSSFFYLESAAAPRRLLVAAMHLSNLLRQFPHTCARLAERDPFERLRAWDAAGRLPGVHADFDPVGVALLGECVAEGTSPALQAAFALEAAALQARKRLLAPAAEVGVRWRPGVFLHASPLDLPALLAGQPPAPRPGHWLVGLEGDLGLQVQAL
ncbi:MAG: B12-binding domain-containing radical SAM protein, partial [Myxococcales bacterium]|nr:B12-binding domain-containing radical SAM protein [Myxococcales bacterium]